jgi:hypothetical protein
MTPLTNLTTQRSSRQQKNTATFSIRLVDANKETKPPLARFPAKVERLDKDGKVDAILFAGRAQRSGEIHFQLDLPTETAEQPIPALAKVRVTVFDFDGVALYIQDFEPKRDEKLSPAQVNAAPHDEKLRGPLDRWAEAVGQTLSAALKQLLKDNQIDSLADLRTKDLSKEPGLSNADKTQLMLMKVHANLQLVSRDHKINKALIQSRYLSVLDIARDSRGKFMKKVETRIPQAKAMIIYAIAQIIMPVLNTIYTERYVDWTNGLRGSLPGGIDIAPPCQCDCGSAVSPQAYLVDLLDYAADNVLVDGSTINLDTLELAFGQPFADLLVDCEYAKALVRQVRLCVEVLHRRSEIKNQTTMKEAVAVAVVAHVTRSYEALLRALGTSYRELRQVRLDPVAARLVAERIGITDDADLFRLEPNNADDDQTLNEKNLERLFGLQGTARDRLSTGAKFNDDTSGQITRWQLRGVEWGRNTDDLGRIYLNLIRRNNSQRITLFKDAQRTDAGLVASAATGLIRGEVELVTENKSGLAGRIKFDYTANDTNKDNTSIYFAVVPEWVIRRRNRLRDLWLESDQRTSTFSAPIIDPDVVFKSDLMRPLTEFTAPPLGTLVPQLTFSAYGLWKSRKDALEKYRNDLNAIPKVRDMLGMALSLKPGDLARWEVVAENLRSADANEANKAKDDVRDNVNANLTPATFSFLVELWRRENAEREVKPEEREQALDVLTNVHKRGLFGPNSHPGAEAGWKAAESNIRLSPSFFVLSETEPVLNPLRASAEERASWRAELERNSAFPLIDPDIISRANFAPTATSTGAFQKWMERKKRLAALYVIATPVNSVAELDAILTGAGLVENGQPILKIGFTDSELSAIAQAFADGTPLPINPRQYGLTLAELEKLFEVRRLGTNADTSDWDHVRHILIQIVKRRSLYPQWLNEERNAQISLSPNVFHVPSDFLAGFIHTSAHSAGFLQWRFDAARLRDWCDRLQARIEEDRRIDEELQRAIDAAEETSLPRLRDDLVKATVSKDDGGESTEERKRWVMNQLLINAFESGCRKTTRVAQAIETMQLLLWGIHTLQFENLKYSLESASAETFAEEWYWLGSYATWRSAMFTFLYPENILLPELRRAIPDRPDPDMDPTKHYRAILRVISGDIPQPPNSEPGPDEEPPQPIDEETEPIVRTILAYLDGKDPQSLEAQKQIYERVTYWRLHTYFEPVKKDDRYLVPDQGPQPDNVDSDPYYKLIRVYYDQDPGDNEEGQSGPIWYRYLISAAFLEDVLYLPLTFALSQLQKGYFQEAVYWFSKVYDFRGVPRENSQGWANPRLAMYFAQRETTDSQEYEGFDDWLDDKLNPHRIAATRMGADLRFVILSIARCLLDYADSEFAKDNSESLARARELYETARRLLDSDLLGKKLGDCEGVIGTLLTEIGEDVEAAGTALDRDVGNFDEENFMSKEDHDRFINGIAGIRTSNPPLSFPERRQQIINLVNEVFTPDAPMGLDQRRLAGNTATFNAYDQLLKEPGVFNLLQQTSLSGSGSFLFSSTTRTARSRDRRLEEQGRIRPPRFEFCIPRNPLIALLRLRYEANWFKLNNCMNLAGQHREVPAYAAPTDTYSGLPVADIGGTAALTAIARVLPTQYRYRVLIERARQFVSMAQQMEGSYLLFIEKRDQEAYNILRARQDLGVATANVTLQDMKVTEATDGQTLADAQFDRSEESLAFYKELLEGKDLATGLEAAALILTYVTMGIHFGVAVAKGAAVVAAGLAGDTVKTAADAGTTFGAATVASAVASAVMDPTVYGGITGGLSTLTSALSMQASFERRKRDWMFQRELAGIDKDIAAAQQTLAKDRYEIALQEKHIADMSAANASEALNFLNTKFTSAELYSWMGGIVGSIYRYLLQEATTIAKLAQRQLAFERQQPELPIVLDDYWTYTDTSAILLGGKGSAERRGMTGSARLLQDITRLDQEAFLTDQRKLQLTKTFSLALHDPVAFARFRESGSLVFSITLDQFDRNFPGHYLRLIKRLRVSVIALVPPIEGIRATLSSPGTSRVIRGGPSFVETEIQRPAETIAFTSPLNATGVFELQEQPEMLLPFEGIGVAGIGWTLHMPRAANTLNYGTIADVMLTIEYTALESDVYRSDVIQRLNRSTDGERPFSFRRDFADQWYDLNHPELVDAGRQMLVFFETRRSDFPPNLTELRIAHVSMYFVRKEGFTGQIDVESLMFTPSGAAGRFGGKGTTTTGLITTRERERCGSWPDMQGREPVGQWELNLLPPGASQADSDKIKGWFKNGDIEDILFLITFSGTTPKWPDSWSLKTPAAT